MKHFYWIPGAILSLLTGQAMAIGLGNLDDFEDETTQGWSQGPVSPNPPIVIPGGGDGGGEDAYLEVSANGGPGAGGRLVVFNEDPRWTGDWIAAGVNKIRINLANFGASDLQFRVAVGNPQSAFCYSLTTPVNVPADAVWRNFEILIDESTMTQVSGAVSFADALANVNQLRLLSSAAPSCQGDQAEAFLGIDDVQSDADIDLDGINNSIDNCTDVANPRVCIDNTGAVPVPALAFTNQVDCETAGFNWGQPDTDGDLYGNACDFDIAPQPGPFPSGDCQQNFLDLQTLKNAFFSNSTQPQYNPDADFDFGGTINFNDLQALKNGLFGTPGPGLGNCGCAPDVANDQGNNTDFVGLQMFVRGGLILDWGAVNGINNFVDLGAGNYQARVQLVPGNYGYKVADNDWNIDYANEVDATTPGGPAVTLNGRCGVPDFCAPSEPDPGQGNSPITIDEAGCYQFDMVAGPADEDAPFEADTVDVTVTGPLP